MKIDIAFRVENVDGSGMMPDVFYLKLDLGDGAVALVEITGPDEGPLMPRHIAGLKRLIDRVGMLLCDQIEIASKEVR